MRSQRMKLGLEEFENSLDRIAQFSDRISALPDEAFSRESLTRITTDVLRYLAEENRL